MATLEKRSDSYRVIFYYRNERFTRSLKTVNKQKAEELQRRLEGNLQLLEQGRLDYVPGTDDLPTVLLTDGILNARPEVAKAISLGKLLKDYLKSFPPGKEKNTAYTERIHIKHLLRLLGRRTPIQYITSGALQRYITERSREKSRLGENISAVTIKKELGTLASIWNHWATSQGLVVSPLSIKNLKYPKKTEKLPFMTWEQIEKKIQRGKLNQDEKAELWDCLFLTLTELEELLAFVKHRWKGSRFPWVYPMFCFAIFTGARRSEILRSQVQDLDFEANEVVIREKKKDRSKKETLRQVPMAAPFRKALQEWLKVHPGGLFTFCKKESEPLTAQMASHYLRWTLDESKWRVIKGWHVFRHSLISNLASRGIQEGVIMEIAGHLNRETTRRYTHLVPSTLRNAIHVLFRNWALVAEPE